MPCRMVMHKNANSSVKYGLMKTRDKVYYEVNKILFYSKHLNHKNGERCTLAESPNSQRVEDTLNNLQNQFVSLTQQLREWPDYTQVSLQDQDLGRQKDSTLQLQQLSANHKSHLQPSIQQQDIDQKQQSHGIQEKQLQQSGSTQKQESNLIAQQQSSGSKAQDQKISQGGLTQTANQILSGKDEQQQKSDNQKEVVVNIPGTDQVQEQSYIGEQNSQSKGQQLQNGSLQMSPQQAKQQNAAQEYQLSQQQQKEGHDNQFDQEQQTPHQNTGQQVMQEKQSQQGQHLSKSVQDSQLIAKDKQQQYHLTLDDDKKYNEQEQNRRCDKQDAQSSQERKNNKLFKRSPKGKQEQIQDYQQVLKFRKLQLKELAKYKKGHEMNTSSFCSIRDMVLT